MTFRARAAALLCAAALTATGTAGATPSSAARLTGIAGYEQMGTNPTPRGPVRTTTAAGSENGDVAPEVRRDLRERDGRNSAAVRTAGQRTAATRAGQYGIQYHGGPVMTTDVHVYVIWYGAWDRAATVHTPADPAVIGGFLRQLGGSPWYGMNGTYVDGKGAKVTPVATFAGQATDSYSQGKALSDAGVGNVVAAALSSKALPTDPAGVYLVLTSSDVSETSGFLTSYCGWHSAGNLGTATVKFGFVGDASKQLASCAAQTATSPNNNPAADAMISVIAHEIAETASDPMLNAWFDTRGAENADKCAWTFGTLATEANGSRSNLVLGTSHYLVQRNWKNVAPSGSCAMS